MNVGADGHCIVFVKEYIFVDDNEAGGWMEVQRAEMVHGISEDVCAGRRTVSDMKQAKSQIKRQQKE